MYKCKKNNKSVTYVLITVLLLVSFKLLMPEDMKIIPVPPPESAFEIQNYNYIGLLQQILKDKMIISDKEFYFKKSKVIYQFSLNGGMVAMNEKNDKPVMPPNPSIAGLNIKDSKNMTISLEDLKEMTPAVIKFYSEDYRQGRSGPFEISEIKVENVIPTDIPDSLYSYKQGLSPFQKHKESIPK